MGTPSATPAANAEPYAGPLAALWDEPWLVEGRLLRFNGVILQRMVAKPGRGIVVGADRRLFRSLLLLEVPSEFRNLFVATNDPLDAIADKNTVHVEGLYGGKHGPGWTEPLIIATAVRPVARGDR